MTCRTDCRSISKPGCVAAPHSAEHESIRRHLAACSECAAVYAMMLEHEAASAAGQAPQPLPEPDFALLPGRARPATLRAFVTALAGDLLRVLRPKDLPDLAYLAEGFFDSLRMLPPGARPGASLSPVLGAGGKGQVQAPVVTRYLAATLAATQALREQAGSGQVDTLAAAGGLERLARPIAENAAARAGLDRKEAARFADEYVRRVLESPADFQNITPEL